MRVPFALTVGAEVTVMTLVFVLAGRAFTGVAGVPTVVTVGAI